MQQLQATFHSADVRIVNGRPVTVVLKDVADALGYRDAHRIKRSIKEKYLVTHTVGDTSGRDQKMLCVTRPGLSQALATLRPQDPEKRRKVEAFQDWLYEEVLESIYDTGSYRGDGAPVRAGAQDDGDILALAGTLLEAAKEARAERRALRRDQEQTEHEVEQLEGRIQELEATRQAPASATTRFGHRVDHHTWDGMRRAINARVQADQKRSGNPHNSLWRHLYDSVERKYGFHALRLYERRGGSSAIKCLDFGEMRAVLAVSAWLFPED